MSLSAKFEIRSAQSADALCLGALATQVFFDTYATSGINSALANEAKVHYSDEVFASVAAEVILTHCAEVKVTHLGEDDGFFGAVVRFLRDRTQVWAVRPSAAGEPSLRLGPCLRRSVPLSA